MYMWRNIILAILRFHWASSNRMQRSPSSMSICHWNEASMAIHQVSTEILAIIIISLLLALVLGFALIYTLITRIEKPPDRYETEQTRNMNLNWQRRRLTSSSLLSENQLPLKSIWPINKKSLGPSGTKSKFSVPGSSQDQRSWMPDSTIPLLPIESTGRHIPPTFLSTTTMNSSNQTFKIERDTKTPMIPPSCTSQPRPRHSMQSNRSINSRITMSSPANLEMAAIRRAKEKSDAESEHPFLSKGIWRESDIQNIYRDW